ncbi:MAG: cyclodeaminase/cyclohydrolase family protein [Myxococcota bacterium]
MSGLCDEGAWEAAVGAIRRLDLDALLAAHGAADPASEAADADLKGLTALLARQFLSPGPPAAGSGAAATGAIAAGLLEWTAGHSERHGPGDFRPRARAIRARATLLREALADAARDDAETVRRLIDTRETGAAAEARVAAAESVLEVASRCSQVAALAAEVAAHTRSALRPDVAAALQLAWSASQAALGLLEANLGAEDEDTQWSRDARRAAWRIRLVLGRAAPLVAGLPDPPGLPEDPDRPEDPGLPEDPDAPDETSG